MIISENRLSLFGIMLKRTRLGWRPGTALAVGGPWRKPGSPTYWGTNPAAVGYREPCHITSAGDDTGELLLHIFAGWDKLRTLLHIFFFCGNERRVRDRLGYSNIALGALKSLRFIVSTCPIGGRWALPKY